MLCLAGCCIPQHRDQSILSISLSLSLYLAGQPMACFVMSSSADSYVFNRELPFSFCGPGEVMPGTCHISIYCADVEILHNGTLCACWLIR